MYGYLIEFVLVASGKVLRGSRYTSGDDETKEKKDAPFSERNLAIVEPTIGRSAGRMLE